MQSNSASHLAFKITIYKLNALARQHFSKSNRKPTVYKWLDMRSKLQVFRRDRENTSSYTASVDEDSG